LKGFEKLTEELEKQLLQSKINQCTLLIQKLNQAGIMKWNDYKLPEDRPVAFYDSFIEILNTEFKTTEIETKFTFEEGINNRENLSKKELKELEAAEKRMLKQNDSVIATLDPRATLFGNLYKANSILLRYRGRPNDEFSKKYPLGVLM